MIKSLEGNWRQELIFVLQQELEMYDTYQRRVAECDQELQKHLRVFAATVAPVKKELRFYLHGSLRQALDQCPT
jgi:transposase